MFSLCTNRNIYNDGTIEGIPLKPTIIRKIRIDKNFVFELLNSYTPTAFGEFG